MNPDDWLVTWTARPDAVARLLCLPPAGGSAQQFRPWSRLAPATVEVVAVELPGRGRRRDEPVITEMAALLDALAPAVVPLLDRPLAIVGHSAGALIGTELAHALRDRTGVEPGLLVAAACRSPRAFYGRERVPEPSEAELVDALTRQDGVPAGVLDSPRYRAMFLVPLRGDVALIERHHPAADRAPLTCPVSAYVARDDQVDRAEVDGWRAETTGGFRSRTFPGGHHFVVGYAAEVLTAVCADLGDTLGRRFGEVDTATAVPNPPT